MQEYYDVINEMGILSNEVYDNDNFLINHIVTQKKGSDPILCETPFYARLFCAGNKKVEWIL